MTPLLGQQAEAVVAGTQPVAEVVEVALEVGHGRALVPRRCVAPAGAVVDVVEVDELVLVEVEDVVLLVVVDDDVGLGATTSTTVGPRVWPG